MYNNIISQGYAPIVSYCASCAPQASYTTCNSGIEAVVHNDFNLFQEPSRIYSSNSVQEPSYMKQTQHQYYFTPDPFLNPNRIRQRFIGEKNEIEDLINQAFEATTNTKLPNDIDIRICNEDEFVELTGMNNIGIRGVTLNRRHLGQISQIIVKEDELDKVLLTIGHELGHAITMPINDSIKEEAKAFSFQIAWMEKIHEQNIGELATSINLDFNPATNGVHDVAFNKVGDIISNGINALDLFNQIRNNTIKIY